MNILVTGANGFIGSKIIEKLISLKKYKVSGLVRQTGDLTFLEPYKSRIKLFFGNICYKESLLEAFKKQDIVIHCAAYTSDWGKYSYFYDVNTKGTKNTVELCLQNSVKHLIYFSTVSIYGFERKINAAEETKIISNSYHYCRTKLLAEQSIRHFMDVFNLQATIIQPGLIFGPNDRTMSYKIIEAINKYLFGLCDNGGSLLSPCYIDNLLKAVMLIIKKPQKSIGRTYIVTDDLKISWYEFTRLFCLYLKKPMPWLRLPRFAAFIIAFLSEKLYGLLNLKISPLMTRYRISLIGNDFHFTPKRIMKELGYKPDRDIKKNIQRTIESYKIYSCQ